MEQNIVETFIENIEELGYEIQDYKCLEQTNQIELTIKGETYIVDYHKGNIYQQVFKSEDIDLEQDTQPQLGKMENELINLLNDRYE